MPDAPAALRGLFVEMNDLKRVHSAGREGSIAERLFAQGWSSLTGGAPSKEVALDIAATTLAATRLCDLDAAFLAAAGLSDEAASAVLVAGFDAVSGDLDPDLRDRLRQRLLPRPAGRAGPVPSFVAALARQPRAGVTCPGRPRILLEPPENHAEHCLIVAVYGVCLSPFYRADPGIVFLAAMAHHFHNAAMPDAGFTGEMLLGDHLGPIMAATTGWALAELDEPLRGEVERARAVLPDDATAEGRAFHAADCVDRVLQIAQHLRGASTTMAAVLDEWELVHAGPVKGFHDRVLRDMRIPLIGEPALISQPGRPSAGAVPRAMIPFELRSPLTGNPLKPDAPHALRDAGTGTRWPMIDGIPYLRVGREALVERVLAHLDAGEPDEALAALLTDQDDWWNGPPADPAGIIQLIKDRRHATLRDAVDRLGWGRVGDYFLHRWSDPTFLAGLTLLEAHWNEPRCVFEFACGIGHYLRELERRGCKTAGADVVFAKLWVARHWVVGPKPQLVCFDAGSPHWPIADAPVDLVLCNDAFYFLDDKAVLLENLRQNAGDDGWLALSHIHNRDCPGFSAGRAVTAEEIAEFFPDALVYDDAELTRALVEARAPVPQEPAALRRCEAFSVVAGPGMRPAPRAVVDGLTLPKAGTVVRLNPLYRPEADGHAIRWPSERYREEYAPRATYPLHGAGPEHLTFDGRIDGAETQRVRAREYVDLPERW